MKRNPDLLIALAILIVACTLTALPTATPLAPISIPTPTRTPGPFPNPVLKVTGAEEVVFDWATDRCEKYNLPDLPVRAFRDREGQTQLIISHTVNYRMIGPDLNHLKIDCNRLMGSQFDPDPSLFHDSEWIASPYTEDGQTVYTIIHDEYHGWEHRGQCSVYSTTTAYFPCWYNALTLAVSTDGGRTYEPAAPSPAHLVATLPFVYKADAGPAGPRNPSNIIKGRDGAYYMFLNWAYYTDSNQWVCLLQSPNLSDPASWKFWDGNGFDEPFVNPYTTTPDRPNNHVCPALDRDDIGASLNDSVTYNAYLDRYVLVGISADTIGGREVWGFYYSFSDDLIHWTHRKLLAEMVLPWVSSNTGIMFLYPSLLDPASESRNYEISGKTAYLYYTRFNNSQGRLYRALVRVPVEFYPSESEARTATPVPVPSTESSSVALFTGLWEGIDPLDGSIVTVSLIQNGNELTGTFKDSFSSNVKPPGFEGNGSGTILSTTTAQITFNLRRWDGKTALAIYTLTISNQNNTLTLNCEVGCPTALRRK